MDCDNAAAGPVHASTTPPWGWQPVHVGFQDDGYRIDGLDVWALPWRAESGDRVSLPHPAHPAQCHSFDVYSIDDGHRASRFAVAELSNGVWGFYRWMPAADAAEGRSADGRLRYVHDLGEQLGSRFDHATPDVRIERADDGALLFEGDAWTSSRVVPQHDGALLLVLMAGADETIFRIDPATDSFRDLATVDEPQPIVRLAAGAAAAFVAAEERRRGYVDRRVAPDGSIVVERASSEWSNSHWVYAPRVIEVGTGRVLLDLRDGDWDAMVSFPRNRCVMLDLRRYAHGGEAMLQFDLAANMYRILQEATDVQEGPLADWREPLLRAMERSAAASVPRRTVREHRGFTTRSFMISLLILIGAAITVAALTLISLHVRPEPEQVLTPVPVMPDFGNLQ